MMVRPHDHHRRRYVADQLRTRVACEIDEQRIELDAANHQRRRTVGFDDRRLAARPFEIQAADGVRRDARQLSRKIGESFQNPEADAPAARFVSGKLRPVEQAYGYAGARERPRRSRSRGSGTYD